MSQSSRSDADYAIEFGGYLAKDADQLRDAVNAYFKAKESENEARIAKAEETLSECMSAARAGAFEFRKRADRAIASRSERLALPKPESIGTRGYFDVVISFNKASERNDAYNAIRRQFEMSDSVAVQPTERGRT